MTHDDTRMGEKRRYPVSCLRPLVCVKFTSLQTLRFDQLSVCVFYPFTFLERRCDIQRFSKFAL